VFRSRRFGIFRRADQIDEARRWWPLLQELHRLHLRPCLLNGLGSLFGGGSACVHARLTDFSHPHGLSPRESGIVLQMTRACQNASIARHLGLTVGTIENYKRRLYEKLDVTSEREVFTLIITHLFGAPAQT